MGTRTSAGPTGLSLLAATIPFFGGLGGSGGTGTAQVYSMAKEWSSRNLVCKPTSLLVTVYPASMELLAGKDVGVLASLSDPQGLAWCHTGPVLKLH